MKVNLNAIFFTLYGAAGGYLLWGIQYLGWFLLATAALQGIISISGSKKN